MIRFGDAAIALALLALPAVAHGQVRFGGGVGLIAVPQSGVPECTKRESAAMIKVFALEHASARSGFCCAQRRTLLQPRIHSTYRSMNLVEFPLLTTSGRHLFLDFQRFV